MRTMGFITSPLLVPWRLLLRIIILLCPRTCPPDDIVRIAFRCNVICCMFVLLKSTCSAGQGFYEVSIFGLMLLSETETTSFLSSVGAFMLDRRASKVE